MDGRLDDAARAKRVARGARQAEWLSSCNVTAVAVTYVDTSGITRVKGVPVGAFDRAAGWGVGTAPVFDAFGADDSIADTPGAVPAGDLRLVPDPDRLVVLGAQPGWAWAPGDRYTQVGVPHTGCSRAMASRTMDRLAEHGLTASAGYETEWVLFPGPVDPATTEADRTPSTIGPAYGMARLIEVSDYAADLLRTLAAQGVSVRQLHPEYSPGQLELSVAPESPVDAADTAVLVRSTIRAVAARHGYAVSFAPVVTAGGVGSGGHLHVSLARDGRSLFSGGDGVHGLTREAEAFIAGVLARLPALLAVGAPSVASYLRLGPSVWSGAYGCWGLENREAAVRLVTGSVGEGHRAANVEIKCFDLTANPYLLMASVLAAGTAGVEDGDRLPAPVTVNPATLSDAERAARGVHRLPETLDEALDAFAADLVLTGLLGPELTETMLAVRRAEIERFAESSPEQIAAATRWRH